MILFLKLIIQKTDMPDNGHHLQVRSIIEYRLSKNLEKIRDILCNQMTQLKNYILIIKIFQS